MRKLGSNNPIAKGWQVYRDIEASIKNMATVLPLIHELHSPAMCDRHWKSLATVTGARDVNPKDPKFCLADLLSLQLHEHTEDVEDIVETASKEQKIDKKLTGIEETWASLQLDFVQHKNTEVFTVRASDDVIEALEAHQMELQSIVGMGRFVDFFRSRVMHWQRALGTVETVLKYWLNVTKQWSSLESIFLASADIREQLAEDTKRFEGVDSDFKVRGRGGRHTHTHAHTRTLP